MGFKNMIICILIIVIGLLVINYIFQSTSFAGVRNSIRDSLGKINYKEKIKTQTTCSEFDTAQDIGMNFMGVDAKNMMKFDCTNFCEELDLNYSSVGCSNKYINCYCK